MKGCVCKTEVRQMDGQRVLWMCEIWARRVQGEMAPAGSYIRSRMAFTSVKGKVSTTCARHERKSFSSGWSLSKSGEMFSGPWGAAAAPCGLDAGDARWLHGSPAGELSPNARGSWCCGVRGGVFGSIATPHTWSRPVSIQQDWSRSNRSEKRDISRLWG